MELEAAPELATELALPVAMASPVSPEPPEEPLTAPMPLAAPVGPVGPELPDTADGAELALEVAGPVVPELVEEDWAVTGPEAPDCAKGLVTIEIPPPAPPSAVPVATAWPPSTVTFWVALLVHVASLQTLVWRAVWLTLEAIESQFYEGGANGSSALMPKDQASQEARRRRVREGFLNRSQDVARRYRARHEAVWPGP